MFELVMVIMGLLMAGYLLGLFMLVALGLFSYFAPVGPSPHREIYKSDSPFSNDRIQRESK